MKQVFESNCGSRQQESLDAIKLRTEKSALFLLRQKVKPSFQAYPAVEQSEISHRKYKGSELIRDMSNLPTFLQQVKDKSVQDKALNFGVLDWKQLEKWKYTERMPGKCSKKTTSKSVFPANGIPRMNPNMAKHYAGNEEFNGSCSFNSQVPQDSPTSISEWSQSNGSWPSHEGQSSPLSSDAATQGTSPLNKRDAVCSANYEVENSAASLKKSEARSSSVIRSPCTPYFDGEPSMKGGRALSPFHKARFSRSLFKSSASKFEGPSVDNLQSEHANAGGRGRSKSPIRRLLDPFLKQKTAQSSETIRPPNGNLFPVINKSSYTEGPSQNRKVVVSKVQALLQLHIKNGLPFYKFVVETSSSMLIAAAKKVHVSGIPDPSMIYTFYSVREIKKKSMNWISRGSDSKSCSLAYNMIGQMRISSKCNSRECVLYGADPQRENKPTVDFPLPAMKEIAAIVTHTLCKTIDDGDGKDCSGTVLILPGGVHGSPTKGSPSSLISRWRSGSCDCGGWDTGCKLKILSELYGDSKNLRESTTVDHLNLFSQGQHQKSKPILSMEALRSGMYCIEFADTVSLLEAFGSCVAHLSCRRFDGMMDVVVGSDEKKTQKQLNSSCPPLSPVGRS